MPETDNQTERRIRESRRMHAAGAGIITGSQVYLLGAGAAVPLAGNGAWLACLAAIPAAALFACLARRRLMHGGVSRAGLCALALSGFLGAAFSCAALAAAAEQSFLPQAQGIRIAVLTAVFISLCAAYGKGCVRLCFFVRWALPFVLIVSSFFSLPRSGFDGLFPLLGFGAGRMGLAAAMMTAAAYPPLFIMLPPQELAAEANAKGPLPGADFYAGRAAVGAAAGCALMFLLCAKGTPESLAGEQILGKRFLSLAGGGTHQGIFDTAVILTLAAACALSAAQMLASAETAVCLAFPHGRAKHGALIGLSAALLVPLGLFASMGYAAAPAVGLSAVLPGLLAAALSAGKQKGGAS